MLNGVGSQRHLSVTLPQGRKTSTHVTVAWVALGACVDGYGKPCPYSGYSTEPSSPLMQNNSYHCLVRLPPAIHIKVHKTFGNLPDVMHMLLIFMKV